MDGSIHWWCNIWIQKQWLSRWIEIHDGSKNLRFQKIPRSFLWLGYCNKIWSEEHSCYSCNGNRSWSWATPLLKPTCLLQLHETINKIGLKASTYLQLAHSWLRKSQLWCLHPSYPSKDLCWLWVMRLHLHVYWSHVGQGSEISNFFYKKDTSKL